MSHLRISLRGIFDATEGAIGFITAATGGWLLVPFFDTLGDSATFTVMARLTYEFIWGALFLVSGVILFGGALFRHRLARWVGAGASHSLWAIAATLIVLTRPESLGVAVFGCLAFLSGYLFACRTKEYVIDWSLKRDN